MSYQAVEWVMKHSTTTGTDRLVMLAIAEQSRNESPYFDAWESWPGLARITTYAGLSQKRTTSAAITRLVRAGLLERVKNGADQAAIRGDRRPNLYRIPVANGRLCQYHPCWFCDDDGRLSDAQREVAPRADGRLDDASTGGCPSTSEPSLDPYVESEENPLSEREILIAQEVMRSHPKLAPFNWVSRMEVRGLTHERAVLAFEFCTGQRYAA